MPRLDSCPACGSHEMSSFYTHKGVPVHSVMLLRTRQEALSYPKGDIELALCSACGLITNVAFDVRLIDYSTDYESTQQFSPTFRSFNHELARNLIDRYDVREKTIIEIGCGQGEFLSLLCELGDNRGIGFDPAYTGRTTRNDSERLTFVQDFYSEKYATFCADLYCCEMTLEHIQDVATFVGSIRKAVGDVEDTVIFFQVPNATKIFRDLAFWDIYYEHCTYFTSVSLARLFASAGFSVLDLRTEYDEQYLLMDAKANGGGGAATSTVDGTLAALIQDVNRFGSEVQGKIEGWRRHLTELRDAGRRVVVWGAGSKCVAFVTAIGMSEAVEFAVDINPLKHGTFLAGCGQEIVAPESLTDRRPDLVIVMNPVYEKEISRDLKTLGLSPRIELV